MVDQQRSAGTQSRHPYLSGPYPRALAHRGWCLGELAGMENSMSALRQAVREGFRYLEIDVHATSDGVVVVHHDPTLDRTTDRRGPIAEQPWREVRQARIAGREPVPALREVIEELPDALLNIDVKADHAVRPVLRLLTETDVWHRVALASFSHARLTRVRRVGGARLVTSCSPRDALALRLRGWLGQAHLGPLNLGPLNLGPLNLGPLNLGRLSLGWVAGALRVPAQMAQLPRTQGPLTVVDAGLVEAAHALGIEVHVWTVNRREEMRELLDIGVDGLITDRPDLLRELLRERGAWPGR